MDRKSRTLFRFPPDHAGVGSNTLCSDSLRESSTNRHIARIRQGLHAILREFMIPRYITAIATLPNKPNGKVDRQLLLKRAQKSKVDSVPLPSRRQPTADTQLRVRKVWADILRLDAASIGLDDNFFMLGGNSITAMRLVSRAREHFLRVSIADVFRNPTLERLAGCLQQLISDEPDRIFPDSFQLLPKGTNLQELLLDIATEYPSLPAVIEYAYPCTPLQEGLLSLTTKRHGSYVVQTVTLLPPTVSLASFKEAWNTVFRLLPILRTRILWMKNLSYVQVVCKEELQWSKSSCLEKYQMPNANVPMADVWFQIGGWQRMDSKSVDAKSADGR